MKFLLLLASLVLSAVSATGQVAKYSLNKSWQFPAANGSVVVRLTAMPSTKDGDTIYVLQIVCQGATPTLADEVEFLKVVTRDMKREGLSPERIIKIDLELRESDVSKQLALAAYKSPVWLKAKPRGHAVAVVKILNAIGAYDPFNQVFSEYGLSVIVSHAEYISTVTPAKLRLSKDVEPKLPSGATLEIVLHQRNSDLSAKPTAYRKDSVPSAGNGDILNIEVKPE